MNRPTSRFAGRAQLNDENRREPLRKTEEPEEPGV
jgi:hypothetical protein